MARGKEILARVAITIALLGALVLALGSSSYEWDFAPAWERSNLYLWGLGNTLAATGVAYVIGLIFGVAVALARLARNLVVRHLGDLYVEIIRGTPVLVQVTSRTSASPP